jgi:quaternary ammonium compound-resistance protein SugE
MSNKPTRVFLKGAVEMAWIILAIGSLCEVGWLVGMKYADGFTRFWPTVIMLFFMIASVGCLGIAVKTIPAGTAYAVWTGGSVAAVTVVGVYLFNEPATPMRLASIGLIVTGIVGLRLLNGAP